MSIKPKKSLGQNFLRDTQVLERIVAAANLSAEDFVLEIGPGEGVLTQKLAKKAGRVLAIEIDQRLIESLQKRFASNQKIEIIHADILKINLADLYTNYQLLDTKYKVVANLPYYITSPIIRLFLEATILPAEMILMVQKEVAERIVAQPGQMSILAVAVQYYAQAELLFEVPKEAFYPVPQVDSAVIRIARIVDRKSPSKEETRHFFKIVKAGFSAKRKTLANNLANSLHLEKTAISQKLKTAGISPTARAQELSVADWQNLAAILS